MQLSKADVMALVSQRIPFENCSKYAMHVYNAGMKSKDKSLSLIYDKKKVKVNRA